MMLVSTFALYRDLDGELNCTFEQLNVGMGRSRRYLGGTYVNIRMFTL